jgi:hypothetical protein
MKLLDILKEIKVAAKDPLLSIGLLYDIKLLCNPQKQTTTWKGQPAFWETLKYVGREKSDEAPFEFLYRFKRENESERHIWEGDLKIMFHDGSIKIHKNIKEIQIKPKPIFKPIVGQEYWIGQKELQLVKYLGLEKDGPFKGQHNFEFFTFDDQMMQDLFQRKMIIPKDKLKVPNTQ